MGRTIFVGDVHACRAELEALLARVGYGAGDALVLVGDLVVRGPDPAGTIDLVMRLGARAVRGNHEDKLLRFARDPRARVHREIERTARALSPRHLAHLRSLPLRVDLPSNGVSVVHAGLVPGVPIEAQDPRALMYLRRLSTRRGSVPAWTEENTGVLWGEQWIGPPHVVFGHNAVEGLQLHPWATGLDTGAVYGGRLSALVLREGEAPPPASERRDAIVSVPAARTYYPA